MFENDTPPTPPQNLLNPVMPAPGMPTGQNPVANAPSPYVPPAPTVHTMPERFRSAGASPGGKPSGSKTTKKLVITLIIVVVVAGLGVIGLYIFNKAVKTNTNNTNTTVNTNAASNTNTVATTNVVSNTNTTDDNVNSANTNSVSNTNVASNTNVTSNTNTAANTNTTVNTNSSSTGSTGLWGTGRLASSTDTDTDGLTNVEESVYTTDPSNADTDGDTFIDGERVQTDGTLIGELVNLFDPTKPGGAKLEGSTLTKRVENSSKAYGLLVPTNWTTNESSGLLVITPTLQSGEFFQVRSYENTTSMAPKTWYQTNFPQADTSKIRSIAFNGLEALVSEDWTTVYYFKDTKVYGFTYTTGTISQANYWTTFDMMMRSFKLVTAS